MGTTAFAAQTALLTLIEEAAAFSDLAELGAVSLGYMHKISEQPPETVWLGEIEWEGEEAGAVGYSRRDETYSLLVVIESHNRDDTQAEANGRVAARMTALEALIRDPRALGVSGIIQSGLVPVMCGQGQDPAGRGAVLALHIRITARI